MALSVFSLRRVVEVERVMGIEPTYQAWEARVLPLNVFLLLRREKDVFRVGC